MTLLGKIFTVLIFIMSVAFCILAVATFATHKNWRLVATNPTPAAGQSKGYKEQLEDLQIQYKAKQAEVEAAKKDLELEQAARRAALATLQIKLSLLQKDLADYSERVRMKESELTEQTQAAKTAEESLANITAEVGKLRGDIRLSQQDRDEQYLKALALIDKLNQAEALRRDLEEKHQQLQDQYSRLNAVAQRLGFDDRTLVSAIPPPVEAKVLSVNEADGMVEISVGADEGLKRGHKLQVFRANQYLGEIILREVKTDRAVGDIDKKMQRGRIRRGDNVTTKLS